MKQIRTLSLFFSIIFFFAFSFIAEAENLFVKKDSIDVSKIQNEIIKYYGFKKGDKGIEIKGSDVTLSFDEDADTSEFNGGSFSCNFSTNSFLIGKLNSDLINDVVVYVGIEGPGNSMHGDIFILLGSGDSLQVFKVYHTEELTTNSKIQSNTYPAQFIPEKIEGNQLIGESTCWAESDAHCCPTIFLKTYFKFDNGLVFLKSEKISK